MGKTPSGLATFGMQCETPAFKDFNLCESILSGRLKRPNFFLNAHRPLSLDYIFLKS